MKTQTQLPIRLQDKPILNTEIYEKTKDYDLVAQAIQFLSENVEQQPNLGEIAAHVHLSKFHFQRLFKRWAGISPTQFLHYLTVEYAKERLAQSHSVYNASMDVGLSGSGQLHDLFVNIEAMTPGEYKQQGQGLKILFGFHDTPFGQCLLAATDRGICALRFVEGSDIEGLRVELQDEWPSAHFFEAPAKTKPYVEQIFGQPTTKTNAPIPLLVKGTNFQINVWKALLSIPTGALVTYQDVAEQMGKPKAVRAIANAISRNPVGYIIPCHRVISKAGRIHKYRWGDVRKKAMVGWEAQQAYQ